MKYRAAMDLGGTHCRFYLEDMEGVCLGEFSGNGCTLNLDGYVLTKEILGATILPALAACGLNPEDCEGFVCAASGADTPALECEYRQILSELGFPHQIVLIYNDCAIFLALCEAPALLIASGTGSILWARDEKGGFHRYGGWGHLTSDEGSAFSLALKALSTVTRHLDGDGQAPMLTQLIAEQSGLRTQNAITKFCYQNILEKSKIAAFAPLVFQAAECGEAEALRLLKEAAQALLHGALVLSMHTGAFPSIFLWGSLLLKSDLLSNLLKELLVIHFPGSVVKAPEDTALCTAIRLARQIKEAVSK